jgi:hypothetical protein
LLLSQSANLFLDLLHGCVVFSLFDIGHTDGNLFLCAEGFDELQARISGNRESFSKVQVVEHDSRNHVSRRHPHKYQKYGNLGNGDIA